MDEASASIDPDNEYELQKGFSIFDERKHSYYDSSSIIQH